MKINRYGAFAVFCASVSSAVVEQANEIPPIFANSELMSMVGGFLDIHESVRLQELSKAAVDPNVALKKWMVDVFGRKITVKSCLSLYHAPVKYPRLVDACVMDLLLGYKFVEAESMLLYYPAEYNNLMEDGETVLTRAAADGKSDLIKPLVEFGVRTGNLNLHNLMGKIEEHSPIQVAVATGHLETVKALLANGATLYHKPSDVVEVIKMAPAVAGQSFVKAWRQYFDEITNLDFGTFFGAYENLWLINASNRDINALTTAVKKGDINAVNFLLAHGFKIVAPYHAVTHAVKSERMNIVTAIVDNETVTSRRRMELLYHLVAIAIRTRSNSLLNFVTNYGYGINEIIRDNGDPSSFAIDSVESMQFFLENGGNINLKDRWKRNVLMNAVETNNLKAFNAVRAMASLRLLPQLDVNAVDILGNTALTAVRTAKMEKDVKERVVNDLLTIGSTAKGKGLHPNVVPTARRRKGPRGKRIRIY